MRERAKAMKNRKYSFTGSVMDVCDLKYEDESFDVCIDKSTIDALLCGDSAFLKVAEMMKECSRVLKPKGIYLAISYGKPENRCFHFERPHLDFTIKQYILCKPFDLTFSDPVSVKT